MIKKIQGEKVFLSPVQEVDIPLFVEFMNDLEMSVYIGSFQGVYGLEEERQYFTKSSDRAQLAIHRCDTEETIGLVELMNIDSVHRSAEIGISIGRAENRSRGLGKEAMSLMLEFAFLALNLESIYLTTLDENKRGRSLYQTLGFKEVGKLRNHRYVCGQYRDVIYMDLLKEEFKGQELKRQIKKFL